MTHDTLKLTDEKVLNCARQCLGQHVPLEASGYRCTTDNLLDVLLGVATNRGTVESVCADLVGTPDAETVRTYFNEQLCVEDLPALEHQLNAALEAEVPWRIWHQPQEVALDFHDRPYYGKTPQADGLWVRGQAKDGTTRFYRVATAYVMVKHLRVTLAIHFVLPGADTAQVVETLRKRLKKLGIRVACLYLDKGFEGQAVVTALTQQHQPALIACTIRGKTGGTRALCQGRRSYRTPYTFNAGTPGAYTAELAVCRVFTTARRTGRLQRRGEWLIFILIHLDWSPKQARKAYRRRFGIETSYRCAGQVRGWTTSPNPAYRFLLIAVSFVLLNVWMHLRWFFTQVPRRGGRNLRTQNFQLQRFALFILRALQRRYGYVQEIVAPVIPYL